MGEGHYGSHIYSSQSKICHTPNAKIYGINRSVRTYAHESKQGSKKK